LRRDVLGGGRARCRAAGPQRPTAKLTTREGGDRRAAGAAVLQTEVEVSVRPLDPFLDDELIACHPKDGAADAFRLFARRDSRGPRDFVVLDEIADARLDDRWEAEVSKSAEIALRADDHCPRHRQTMRLGELLEEHLAQQQVEAIPAREAYPVALGDAIPVVRDG